MPDNNKKEDLRITKTYKALVSSMMTLLNRHSFNKITVNDLCEEALISRATFYSHFNDKYDLLKFMLATIRKELIQDIHQYSEIEAAVNGFIENNHRLIININEAANSEVLGILHDFMYCIIDIAIIKKDEKPSDNQILLSNFCAGGMLSLLQWQIKNNFPSEKKFINHYFYEFIKCVTQWDAKQHMN